MTRRIAALLLAFIGTTSIICEAADFTPLFNGKDFSGWEIYYGKHDYAIEPGGTIVGTAKLSTPNGFLTTNKKYHDFELHVQVKCDTRLNSGIQIRSNANSPDEHLAGPQVEIEEGSAGFIYGEGLKDDTGENRRWLSINRAGEKKINAFKANEWNQYRILAEGPRIRTWINGVQIADLVDPATDMPGRIGLQVHSIRDEAIAGSQVRWRKLRIKELRRPKPFKSLYNGRNLRAFQTRGNWQAQADGVLALVPRDGETGWQRWDAYLWSKKQYGDFACSFEYKHEKGGNSGFFFRVTDKSNGIDNGMEVQILDSHGKKGELTAHDCGGLVRSTPATFNAARPAGEWNHMQVRCVGNHLLVHLNGAKVQDLQLDATNLKDKAKRGYISLQDHGENFWLRNLKIQEL